MRRRRFLLSLAALPIGWGLWFASRNLFTITNNTSQTIRWMIVEVCNTMFRFEDIPHRGTVSARFGTPHDESMFEIRGQFADGTGFEDACGYVVWEDYAQEFSMGVRSDGLVTVGSLINS